MQFDQISRNIRQNWGVKVSIFGVISKALFRSIFQRNRTLRPDTSCVLQKSECGAKPIKSRNLAQTMQITMILDTEPPEKASNDQKVHLSASRF